MPAVRTPERLVKSNPRDQPEWLHPCVQMRTYECAAVLGI
jgi:hypothetical protein